MGNGIKKTITSGTLAEDKVYYTAPNIHIENQWQIRFLRKISKNIQPSKESIIALLEVGKKS